MTTSERTHFFATGDKVVWHNEIAEVDFPGYRGAEQVRIKLPLQASQMSPEYRWVRMQELRHLSIDGKCISKSIGTEVGKPDGSVVLSDDVNVDEAAKIFWDAVTRMMPLKCSECNSIIQPED